MYTKKSAWSHKHTTQCACSLKWTVIADGYIKAKFYVLLWSRNKYRGPTEVKIQECFSIILYGVFAGNAELSAIQATK